MDNREMDSLLKRYGFSPKKKLSQHFLMDQNFLQKMVDYADIGSEDTVLEVGAGLGFLTKHLASKAGKVVSVEIDVELLSILEELFDDYSNITFLQGNILKMDVDGFNKVVSTPPYRISSPLLFWLFDKDFKVAVIALQDEFARCLTAPVGSKHYGRLTLTSYYHSEVELLDSIPKTMFFPSPKVNSRIVRLKLRKPPFSVKNKDFLFAMIRSMFANKNRKVRNAVLPFLKNAGLSKTDASRLADSLSSRNERPRNMALGDLVQLAEILSKKMDFQIQT